MRLHHEEPFCHSSNGSKSSVIVVMVVNHAHSLDIPPTSEAFSFLLWWKLAHRCIPNFTFANSRDRFRPLHHCTRFAPFRRFSAPGICLLPFISHESSSPLGLLTSSTQPSLGLSLLFHRLPLRSWLVFHASCRILRHIGSCHVLQAHAAQFQVRVHF